MVKQTLVQVVCHPQATQVERQLNVSFIESSIIKKIIDWQPCRYERRGKVVSLALRRTIFPQGVVMRMQLAVSSAVIAFTTFTQSAKAQLRPTGWQWKSDVSWEVYDSKTGTWRGHVSDSYVSWLGTHQVSGLIGYVPVKNEIGFLAFSGGAAANAGNQIRSTGAGSLGLSSGLGVGPVTFGLVFNVAFTPKGTPQVQAIGDFTAQYNFRSHDKHGVNAGAHFKFNNAILSFGPTLGGQAIITECGNHISGALALDGEFNVLHANPYGWGYYFGWATRVFVGKVLCGDSPLPTK